MAKTIVLVKDFMAAVINDDGTITVEREGIDRIHSVTLSKDKLERLLKELV